MISEKESVKKYYVFLNLFDDKRQKWLPHTYIKDTHHHSHDQNIQSNTCLI